MNRIRGNRRDGEQDSDEKVKAKVELILANLQRAVTARRFFDVARSKFGGIVDKLNDCDEDLPASETEIPLEYPEDMSQHKGDSSEKLWDHAYDAASRYNTEVHTMLAESRRDWSPLEYLFSHFKEDIIVGKFFIEFLYIVTRRSLYDLEKAVGIMDRAWGCLDNICKAYNLDKLTSIHEDMKKLNKTKERGGTYRENSTDFKRYRDRFEKVLGERGTSERDKRMRAMSRRKFDATMKEMTRLYDEVKRTEAADRAGESGRNGQQSNGRVRPAIRRYFTTKRDHSATISGTGGLGRHRKARRSIVGRFRRGSN